MAESEFITLNNGRKMPVVGLGTSQAKHEEVKNAVKFAINAGYRHIDCAFWYGNEDAVGDAIKEVLDDGKIKREDLFITSKLRPIFQSPKYVNEGFELSLRKLKLQYLDLFLIHWPFGLKYERPDVTWDHISPFDESIDYVDTWKVFEQLYDTGKVKAIGVSNFNLEQLERLLKHVRITPAVHQIEFHPYYDQKQMLNFCKSKGIAITSYSPFASPGRPWVMKAGINVFKEPLLQELSQKYRKTIGQIILRYLTQRGTAVIPKSVTEARIKENFQIFDFCLKDSDVAKIMALNEKKRIMPPRDHFVVSHKHFPFDPAELLLANL